MTLIIDTESEPQEELAEGTATGNEDTMMRKLIVDSCGPEYARRFFLRDGNNYWNDIAATWSTNPKDATLFADASKISDKQRELMLQIPGEVQNFVAPLFVEVKDSERVDLASLKAWLAQAVQVWMNSTYGTGPSDDSMVMLSLNWDELMRREDLDNE